MDIELTRRPHDSHVYSGICLIAGIKNANGRIYSQPIVEEAVKNFNKELSQKIQKLGHLGLPMTSKIEFEKVSHIIESMNLSYIRENDAYIVQVHIRTLPTPNGQLFQTLFNSGLKLYAVLRSEGTVNEEGFVNDLKILGVDIEETTSFSF